jgi:ribosome-binding protein aMBF1 (putative translation factor)
MGDLKALSMGRVALLTFAERQIEVNFPQNASNQKPSKPLIQSVKTMTDWIRLNRQAKNLTPGQLAAKMGIAAQVIRSWEGGTCTPHTLHIAKMELVFGMNTS